MFAVRRSGARLLVLVAALSLLLLGATVPAVAASTWTVEGEGESVNLREGPGTGYARAGSVPDGARVTVVCTARGTTETGPWGSTNVWDRLDSGLWISDAFLATGTFEPVEPACDGGGPPSSGGFDSIDGDAVYPITQEFRTYGAVPPEWYAYVANYCLNYGEHGGLDVGTPDGTPLYSPVGGVVADAGGTGFFQDARGDFPGRGELEIQADNGDVLILGHMYQIDVGVGARVEPGTYVGLSGTANGDHVHVEYRTPNAACVSGYELIDPRAGLG
jgi:murein DD-endopeptidase MepM/ murein hydrolase activator NlpD